MVEPTYKTVWGRPTHVRVESADPKVTQRGWVPLKGATVYSEVINKYNGEASDRFVGVYIRNSGGFEGRVTGDKCRILDGAATTQLRYEAQAIVDKMADYT